MAQWLLDCHPACGQPWRLGLATEPHERDQLYRLRYDVFVTEQGYGHVGLDAGAERDMDKFDPWCDHVFLYDTQKQRPVGTYRAIRGSEALQRGGFYASDEFDLAPLEPIAHQILQGGRTCVGVDYRNSLAIQYLSYGMELLLRRYDCRYFLGADSFRTDNPDTLNTIHSYVKTYHADPEWSVEPLAANRVAGLRDVPVSPADEKLLPSIVRADLRLGFLACSPPVWDPGFGCYDILVLGRRDRMSKLYRSFVQRIERQVAAPTHPL
jgi:L-ornithine Nalpha-acyltransferase